MPDKSKSRPLSLSYAPGTTYDSRLTHPYKLDNSLLERVLSWKHSYSHFIHNGPVTASSPVARNHFLGDMSLGKKAFGGRRARNAENKKFF